MFGDFLASALNQNVGARQLAPLATEIETQTVRWIAELIGFPGNCGGLLVSGGNMANFSCLLAARASQGAMGSAQGRAVARSPAPADLCVDRNAYVAPQGGRSRGARDGCDPLGGGGR